MLLDIFVKSWNFLFAPFLDVGTLNTECLDQFEQGWLNLHKCRFLFTKRASRFQLKGTLQAQDHISAEFADTWLLTGGHDAEANPTCGYFDNTLCRLIQFLLEICILT